MHTLIVGPRQMGKSTLIARVLESIDRPLFGYMTKKETALHDEVLGDPVYIYDIGAPRIQTAENLVGHCRDNRSFSNIEAFDRYAEKLRRSIPEGHLIVMDEIGFMEARSEAFSGAVLSLLDGDTPILAAVKDKDIPFLQKVRSHPNCRCFFITEENRDELFTEVLSFVRSQI